MSARSFDLNENKRQGNITILNRDNTREVVLHRTVVVSIQPNQIVLNSGGYRTNTTKTAINRALTQLDNSNRVVQIKGKWFLTDGVNKVEFFDNISIYL